MEPQYLGYGDVYGNHTGSARPRGVMQNMNRDKTLNKSARFHDVTVHAKAVNDVSNLSFRQNTTLRTKVNKTQSTRSDYKPVFN